MIRRRLALVGLQFLLAGQLALSGSLPQPAPVAAASPAASPAATTTGASGQACTVASGASGGLLSVCADAASYADFAAGLRVAMDGLRGAAATGSLSVKSDPAGATVSINGVDAGSSPVDIAVPPGVYLVRIAKDGFVPFSHVVQVAAGGPTNVTKSLDSAAAGNSGSFNWVRPETLIGLLGSSGFADGSFDITGYVRDKDGADYVSFANSKRVTLKFKEPTEIHAAVEWLKSDTRAVTTTGVARSSDDGQTWTLIKSWTGSYTGRTWTSARFDDSQWSAGKPGPAKARWIRAYYYEYKTEDYGILAMVPKLGGGVAVYVTKSTFHQPQELMRVWDSLPADYCREDDKDLQSCLGRLRPVPGRYLTSLTTDGPTGGPYKKVSSPETSSRFGVSQTDLATYTAVRESITTVLDTRTGGDVTVPFTSLGNTSYQGSYKEADYFLALNGANVSVNGSNAPREGYILVARNGGPPVLETTYTLGPDAPMGQDRSEELRIGPDGTLFILDHRRGRIYGLDKGTPVLLASVQPSVWGGLLGADVPSLNHLSVAIDSGGNLHTSFRVGSVAVSGQDPGNIKVYYEYFSRRKTTYQSVALFTKADCKACEDARTWLKAAGVAFQENPTDLAAAVNASVAAAAGSAGFPVVARLGTENVVKGAADPATISRLLGLSWPVLVDTHAVRVGATKAGQRIGFQPDWVLTILEKDQPRIVVQRDEGVVAFEQKDGTWTSTKLMDTPPLMPVSETITADGNTTSFFPRYPLFPGGASNPYLGTARDVPFNTVTTPGDLRFLNRATDGGGQGRMSYTLNTTKSAPTASPYRAIEAVSQLIPSAAFYVALGPNGTPAPVEGELAAYVTSQGVVTDNGYRFYRVVVDLRAQNEIATDGNILARAVGGGVRVETKTKDGKADTRDVSLILLVENTRLRTFDPGSRAIASDITSEAVHFTGDGERWIVTNNIALPNSIPCASGKTLQLPPNSSTTFTAAQVAASSLGSCLDGLEVQPTVLAGCTAWDDARLVLAAQTISSLANSLPLARSESVLNWELTFGSRDATVYRLVSLDQPAPAPGSLQCATAASGKTAALVKISGRFIGTNEVYAPDVSIVTSGTTVVGTAPTTQTDSIAFERAWLEFESTFLEGNLRLAVGDQALSSLLFLNVAGKRAGYQRQLLATRALLHCNQEGLGIVAVTALMARNSPIPEALRGTVSCLNDFVLNPMKHWPGYDRRLWAGGAYDTAFLGTVINSSLVANPTLAWLAAATTAAPTDYGQTLIAHAHALEGKAADPDLRDTAIDFALDDYARLATAASRDAAGVGGPLMRAVLLAGRLERTAIRSVVECVKGFGGKQPLATLIKLTETREYTGGIACVDQRSGQSRIDWYRFLAIGLRSGTFGALYQAAGRDLDLVTAHLDLITTAMTAVEAAEGRYPAGTTVAAWRSDLPALDRLVIATRQLQATAEQRGKRLTVADLGKVLVGVTECGVGLVKGLFPDGILMMAAGGAAVVAGSSAALVGGILFLGFGAVVTGVGAVDLAHAWETLDLTARTAGACGVAVSTLMTLSGARATVIAARSWTPAELRLAPPKMVEATTVETHGRTAGLSLEEQGAVVAARGETISEVVVPAALAIESGLKAVIDGLPEGQRPAALDAARKVGYDTLTPVEQGVVRTMLGRDSPATARGNRIANLILAGKSGTPEFVAWDVAGQALLDALDTSRPKSLAAGQAQAAAATGAGPALPARLAGTDAEVLRAADNAAQVPPGTLAGAEEAVLGRQAYLLQAIAGSERLLGAFQDTGIRRLFTAEEAAALLKRAKAARGTTDGAFFQELAGTRLADSFRTALRAAEDLAGSTGRRVTALETAILTPGQNKVAVRVTIHLDGADPVQIVVAKGNISPAEAALYAQLGPKDITQKLLAPLAEHVDGNQALLITEYVPGRKVSPGIQGLTELAFATLEPAYAKAIGALDARIWLRTKRAVNGRDAALFNTDLHLGNINVAEKGGTATARVVDFDSKLTFDAPEDAYWLTSLFRRSPEMTRDQAQAAQNYDAYLDGVVEAYALETGSSNAAAFDMLRRMSTAMSTPQGRAKAEALFPSLAAEPAGLGATVARDIQTYLAKHGQSSLPVWTVRADQAGARAPLSWSSVILRDVPVRVRPQRWMVA